MVKKLRWGNKAPQMAQKGFQTFNDELPDRLADRNRTEIHQ